LFAQSHLFGARKPLRGIAETLQLHRRALIPAL
jgi:hypothetical protein